MVVHELVDLVDKLAQRIGQAAREDDHDRPIGGFANETMLLPTLRPDGDERRIRPQTLIGLRTGLARLVGSNEGTAQEAQEDEAQSAQASHLFPSIRLLTVICQCLREIPPSATA